MADPEHPFEGHPRTDDLAPAALRAAVGLGRSLGLDARAPRVLADGFWLVVHLAPSPVVARVSTYAARVRPARRVMERELAVAGHLAGLGLPVVPPTGLVDPGPHVRDGHEVSLWELADVVHGAEVDVATCLAMLADLHAGLADVHAAHPGLLEVFGPVRGDLPACLDDLDRHTDLLGPGRVDGLRAAAERLGPFLADPTAVTGVPVVGVHGDLHPGNMVMTRGGPRWLDLEDACLAPREWDLALLSWFAPEDVAAQRPDPELLELCRQARSLSIATWMARFRGEQGLGPAYDELVLGCLDGIPETR